MNYINVERIYTLGQLVNMRKLNQSGMTIGFIDKEIFDKIRNFSNLFRREISRKTEAKVRKRGKIYYAKKY